MSREEHYNDQAVLMKNGEWQLDDSWVKRQSAIALQHKSLTDALSRMACEFSLSYIRADYPWNTYTTLMNAFLNQVRQDWIDARKPLPDFQPYFVPPSPPRG
jgi:hypothetical protein